MKTRPQNNPKLVVYMITYNHEQYIEQAIESVMMQKTSFSYQLLIGEDCSTDNTKKICQKLKHKYPDKISLYSNNINQGSLKNALKMYNHCYNSNAKFIAILEGDDYWIDPLKLQKQVDFLELNPQFTLSFTRFKVKNDTNHSLVNDKYGRFFKAKEDYILFDFEMFTKGWYGGIPTLVFRTSSFNLDSTLEYKYFRDIHLFTELLKKGNGVCLNFYSAVYRIHDGGIHSSATVLERARTGSLCYKELYFKNRDIPALKIKYRYFHRAYIKELQVQKQFLAVFFQAFLFGVFMKDFNFIVSNWKRVIKKIWIDKNKKNKFPGSQQYWEQRYLVNKNSGAGSYGRLAKFKANILNAFIKNHSIKTVIEYGCGDGNQLSLAIYPSYKGFDVSPKAIELCQTRFSNDDTKSFFNMEDDNYKLVESELVLSLDVIYHLIEDKVFNDYMARLFSSSTKYVIIYSSNYEDHFIAHVKCRKFTNWIEKNVSNNWSLIKYIKNRYPFDKNNPNHTSMADFYIYKKV